MRDLGSKFFHFADRILNLADFFEKIPNKLPEILALIIYPILFWLVILHHEPWYDEAQAWQIAKYATYHDIFFYLPHLEGHPPFWHFLLSIFAKNNFPYEMTLRTISFIFSYIAAFVIIFKAPFLRIIKVLLPFTYFLFYQSGVISRPYCMVMLAFCILAILYEKRNSEPFKYSFALIFLALLHPYSFVLSGLLTLSRFVEGILDKEYKTLKFYGAHIILAFFFFIILFLIFPNKEAAACNMEFSSNIIERLIYTFFMVPVECFITSVATVISDTEIKSYELIFGSILGLAFWFYIYFYTKNRGFLFKTVLICYIPFALIAVNYLGIQHFCIIFPFFIFIFWLIFKDGQFANDNIIDKTFVLIITLSLIINLYWSFKACAVDIFLRYHPGRDEAEFIKENNLDKYKVYVAWNKPYIEGINLNYTGLGVLILPYFEDNIFYNFNYKTPEKRYILHKIMSENEVKQTFEEWKKDGYPDVLVGDVDLDKMYNKIEKEYVIVYSGNSCIISKGWVFNDKMLNISVEKELAKKLGLKEAEPELKDYKLNFSNIIAYILMKIMKV